MNREDLTDRIKGAAEKAVRRAEAIARRYYAIDLPPADIAFTLRGRCAGQARLHPNDRMELRFNLALLAENSDDFLSRTIPHEVAHLVVFWRARGQNRRPRPHGPEWQQVMCDCFRQDPLRTHAYRTTPARIVRRSFRYACNCREHFLTAIRHNRMSRHRQLQCTHCHSRLVFLGRVDDPPS